jgi:hypothetical protein
MVGVGSDPSPSQRLTDRYWMNVIEKIQAGCHMGLPCIQFPD